jgi:hypothetical protein
MQKLCPFKSQAMMYFFENAQFYRLNCDFAKRLTAFLKITLYILKSQIETDPNNKAFYKIFFFFFFFSFLLR